MLLVASCTYNQDAENAFAHAENIMNEFPDSAYLILDSIREHAVTWNKAQRMKFELLHAKAQNKAYIDFTTDSIMIDVVEYFDEHGTANEQMEAHYLLGCTYRDLQESPQALSCYLDAIDRADTLSENCDYSAMMRIWGQVAEIFDKELMPYKELEANEQGRQCALKCGDSLNYIIGVELDRRAYFLLGDTSNVINSVMHAHELFKAHGDDSKAAISLAPLIPIYLNRNDTSKVKEIIDIYEEESNLFHGNTIDKGQEGYYIFKASYYEQTNRLDSAEYYYRKADKYGYKYHAYKGLISIYMKTNEIDSVLKYSALKEVEDNKEYDKRHTEAMFNADGMFNYSRSKHLALVKEIEAQHSKFKVIVISIFSSLVFIFCLSLFFRYKSQKKAELQKINNLLYSTEKEYNKALDELRHLEADHESFKIKKNQEIQELQTKWKKLSHEREAILRTNTISDLREQKAVADILKYTRITKDCNRVNMSNKEWNYMFEEIKKHMPHFYTAVIDNATLSEQEQKIAALTIFKLRTNEIAYLLNSSPSNISNAKTSINAKLFSCNSARGLYENLINM